MDKKCNVNCMFFPKEIYNNLDYYVDEKGIKHSNVKPLCNYDGHIITKWKNCPNYKNGYKNKKLILILGKSAAGKDTALNYLVDNFELSPVISYTTRPIRKNETPDKDYYFISNKEFDKKYKNNDFIETRTYETFQNGEKAIWKYGVSKKEINPNKVSIVVVDVDGMRQILKNIDKKNIVIIYIKSKSSLRKERAEIRGSFDKQEWERRAKDDNIKFNNKTIAKYADYIVDNNGRVDNLFNQFREILKKENII